MDLSRVPVVAGVGQVTNREEDPVSAPDPFALMENAAHAAMAGTGENLPADLSHLWMVHSLSVRHGDPAGYLGKRLGAHSAQSRCSGMGGSIPQWLVDRACDLVASGARPRVLIVGAEALATRRRAKKAGVRLDWPSEPGWPDTWPPLEPDLGVHPVERANGLEQATSMYALVETVLRHSWPSGPAEHDRQMGELMERLNEVASQNPHSWFSTRRRAQELLEVTQDNRMIFFPYPKYLNAVMDVDMAAAVVVTDAQSAREFGLAPEDVVYVSGWADAHDLWYLSERPLLDRSEAIAACGQTALGMGGLAIEDVSAFDLYACFPSSVEVARDSLGIEVADPRPLTLTGGLPYHGGPGSNYVTHALCNSFEWLRSGHGESVMVHGNGYYLTKHALGLYTRRPPRSVPAPREDLQRRIDDEAEALAVDATAKGPGSVVAFTAPFDRDGEPAEGIVLADVDGRRTVARADRALTEQLLAGDGVGTAVNVVSTPDANLATCG